MILPYFKRVLNFWIVSKKDFMGKRNLVIIQPEKFFLCKKYLKKENALFIYSQKEVK